MRFRWRDYDTVTSRWTTPDPIGDAGGDKDWYGYCLNDPVNGVDPLGLMGWGFSDEAGGHAFPGGGRNSDTPEHDTKGNSGTLGGGASSVRNSTANVRAMKEAEREAESDKKTNRKAHSQHMAFNKAGEVLSPFDGKPITDKDKLGSGVSLKSDMPDSYGALRSVVEGPESEEDSWTVETMKSGLRTIGGLMNIKKRPQPEGVAVGTRW